MKMFQALNAEMSLNKNAETFSSKNVKPFKDPSKKLSMRTNVGLKQAKNVNKNTLLFMARLLIDNVKWFLRKSALNV